MQARRGSYAGVSSLVITRVFYAINWLNIAAIFSLIAVDFNEGVPGLGLVSFAGFIGAALFQVPGGILSAKIGPKNVIILGTLIASISAILSGLSTAFYHLVVLRFLVGLGLALVYAPGVNLVAKYYREGSEGFAIGLFQSAYYFGGIAGIFGWIILAETLGWRPSLVVGGVLELITALLLCISLPRDEVHSNFKFDYTALRKILFGARMLSVSFSVISLQAGLSIVASFMVFYLESHLGTRPEIAGTVASLYLILSLIASPVSGRIYDRVSDSRRLLFLSAVFTSIGVGIATLDSLYAAAAATILVGFWSGLGYTIVASSSRELASTNPEYQTLAVSWANSMGLAAGFVSPLLFAFLVVHLGYSSAWLLAGLYTVLLALPMLILKGRA